jgi:hypothetical protein
VPIMTAAFDAITSVPVRGIVEQPRVFAHPQALARLC